ncbi:MAG: hypothetical protein COV52_07130 [Gammaproteobacteria bacterium CG11_big_fil_rev_8_21_14_0_20_46_22]|nr:MAG: hypothetical protein COW05_00145 [Gammaproteobacteria bacterium CG12_big_fil_rev_8_21_14_0_65_46_12]PIR10809.1 MAG: hypothetical protein COV52_07130 [Gammaproteobacteria bacterium CG11_big_fil_rev_8_21_14_0_20_46_22]
MAIKEKRSVILWTLLIVVVLALAYLTVRSLTTDTHYYVQQVSVEGVPQDRQDRFKTLVKPLLNRPLLSLDIDQVAQEILAEPWVSEVTVQRVWPDALTIIVQPQELVAQWNDQYALNRFGEVFSVAKPLKGTVKLYGPDKSQVQSYAMFQQFQTLLAQEQLVISSVKQAGDGEWGLTLDNGMQIEIGSKHVLTRLQRFVTVYPKVFKSNKAADGRYVDLRYAHGMAVSRGQTNGKETG